MPRPRTSPQADVPGLAARRIAVDIVDGVLRKRLALDEQLSGKGAHLGLANLPDRDRALMRRLTATVLRRLGGRDPQAMANLARGLGVWDDSMPEANAPQLAADYLDKFFAGLGMPTRLRDLDFPREGLGQVLENSLKNFNADPKREFVRERDFMHDVLQAAW